MSSIFVNSRVEDVQGHVHEVWDEVHVALGATSSTLSTERPLIGKPEKEESEVVGYGVEGWVIEAGALL